MSAKPKRFKPRHRFGLFIFSLPAASPIPQTLSTGLASTRTREAVCFRNLHKSAFWENFASFAFTTMEKRCLTQVASSKPCTLRPKALAAPGFGAFRISDLVTLSPNRAAFSAIMKCSAVAYRWPSTVNEAPYHWLKHDEVTVPLLAWCPQKKTNLSFSPELNLARNFSIS